MCCHGSSGNSVDSSALQSTTWRTSGQNLASAADTFDPSLHYTSTEVLPVAAAAASSSSDSIHQPSWNCFSQLECDALTDFSPPPDLFPFLPPPPLPASLLNSLDVKAAQEREEDPRVSINPRDDGDVCNLCRWANQENDTEVVTEPSTGKFFIDGFQANIRNVSALPLVAVFIASRHHAWPPTQIYVTSPYYSKEMSGLVAHLNIVLSS